MKLLIIGSTGGTGKLLVADALSAGHDVVALARQPASIAGYHSQLQVVAGNVLDRQSLVQAITGVNVVVSALGIGGLLASRRAGDTLSKGTANILAAMDDAGVNRLVAISSVGVEDDPTEGFVYRRILKPNFLNPLYADMRIMETLIAQSALNWTLVRPPRLIDKGPTGKYYVTSGHNVPYARTLTRGDLSQFVLKTLQEDGHGREIVSVSHEMRMVNSTGRP
jgi:putative NADH-flavin reductase